MGVRPLVVESRLDKVQAWLGCNVPCAESSRAKKAEAGGGRYCTASAVPRGIESYEQG